MTPDGVRVHACVHTYTIHTPISLLKIMFNIFNFYVCVFHLYDCVPRLPSVLRDQERVWDP